MENAKTKILVATHNGGKMREIRKLLSEYIGDRAEVLSLGDVGCFEEIEENGETFEDNAFIKARFASRYSGMISVSDDSGLAVNALGGLPGVRSARYATEGHDDAANNAKLLSELALAIDRSAAFVCCMACVMPSGEEFSVRGECRGKILEEYRGSGGFGYDPLFYVPELGKTFAQMTEEEKNSVSHRGAAMRLLGEELKKRL